MATTKVIEAIPTDQELIRSRRNQIARAGLTVFARQGFHKTTVREIAREAGVAVGTIYEYVSTKEDILYLACEEGFTEFERELQEAIASKTGALEKLKAAMDRYYRIMDGLKDNVLLMYRESQSLDKDGRQMLMQREEDTRKIFEHILKEGITQGIFKMENPALVAHDILMLGHMWGLKRWALSRYLNIDQFVRFQTDLLLSGILVT